MDKDSERIAEQAADYFARRCGETPSQRRSREAWLAADARHARAYAAMQRLWEHAANLRGDADLQAIKASDLAAVRRSRRFRPGRALAAAAALVLLLGGAYTATLRIAAPPPLSYATELGERRTEILADGSRVVLNTDSALEVRYTRGRREIGLPRGEAQFDVAHDSARPFVVRAGEGTVTALGTRFQVRSDAGAVTITLLEGSVEVARGSERRILRPNERAHLAAGTGIAVQPVDPERASGWLDGWLRFRNAPLEEVVAEANRYSVRKLRLSDPELAGIVLSGNFHAGDSASIASAVELILPVRVDDSGADIVLVPQ